MMMIKFLFQDMEILSMLETEIIGLKASPMKEVVLALQPVMAMMRLELKVVTILSKVAKAMIKFRVVY